MHFIIEQMFLSNFEMGVLHRDQRHQSRRDPAEIHQMEWAWRTLWISLCCQHQKQHFDRRLGFDAVGQMGGHMHPGSGLGSERFFAQGHGRFSL